MMSQLIVRAGQFIFSALFEELAALGKTVLRKDAQKFRFEEV
jgi:hypothetical protein